MTATDHGILVVTGAPCAGKSSIGRLLAADSGRSRRVYVEVDALFSLLFPGSNRNRDDRMLAYHAAHQVARALFERGLTPILECTYARAEQRSSLATVLAELPEAQLWVVEIEISPDEAVRRFRRRQQATDLDEKLVRERAEHFPYGGQALHLIASPSASADELAEEVRAWLRGGPQPTDRDVWAAAGRAWS